MRKMVILFWDNEMNVLPVEVVVAVGFDIV